PLSLFQITAIAVYHRICTVISKGIVEAETKFPTPNTQQNIKSKVKILFFIDYSPLININLKDLHPIL
ncbi:hypothetical protein, partial [Frisingicoccus sp.]|uniref:hypothetical protein n=1 Tax=Frisingicoccus sp. TaxID=1918627 RepID=UPI00399AB9A2